VALALSEGGGLLDLPLERMRSVDERIGEDVYEALSLESVVNARASFGGTATARVTEAVAAAKEELARDA
jgi:argininosuccinate lyase